MKLYHVVAIAENRVIGKDGRLPWHFSSDLKHFKQLTMGQTILMGRKTFESIGKPLSGRENFVVSQKKQGQVHASGPVPKGAKFFNSMEDALQSVKTKRCYIIGGASIFEQTMEKIDGIYLTKIHACYEGDTFYPEIPAHFKETSKETLQENPKIEVIFYENVGKDDVRSKR